MSELARAPDVLAWLMDPERHASPRYRERVPLTAPGPGEQYAFEVSLDDCTGCKSCVSACHTMNGLDPDENWRKVGLLQAVGAPWQQTVTTACHHCVDPACLAGCPALAYDKDPITGIVAHLDDQCIGCRYCTLTCPYDVPQWSPKRGIVRKCDMCKHRLSTGDAPACVEACPNGAISIAIVAHDRVVAANEGGAFLPGAPDPSITQPSTSFTSARPLPRDAIAADYYAVRAEEAHPPLAIMLVSTQLAVGTFVATQLVGAAGGVVVALALAVIALGASLLHLGRPHLAFRAVLGLRTSWLSREIVVFGAFAAAASFEAMHPTQAFGAIAASLGVLGVFSSVMVYAATRRASWSAGIAGAKFALTTAILGAATAQLIAHDERLTRVLIAALAAKLALELALLARARDRHHGALQRSARLQLGPLRRVLVVRLLAGAGAIACAVTSAPAALAFAFVGELAERHLFFVTVGSPRMPGPVR